MNALTPIGDDKIKADRDTPKSRRTRYRILDAAMRLFAEIGYTAATNARIAEEAKLTRGAMLYHFATRELLIEAAVAHIQKVRLAALTEAGSLPVGADATEHAIDAYWQLLRTPPFLAFAELEDVARTDPDVAKLVAWAQAEFDRAEAGDQPLNLLHAGAGPRFQASRDLARFMLEGMARARMTHDSEDRQKKLLEVIKRVTHMLNRKGSVTEIWPD